MNTIKITFAGETITLTWNGAEASAPLRLNGDLTQYQTADARHRTAEAVRLVAGLAWPDVDFADGSEAWDELEYGPKVLTSAWTVVDYETGAELDGEATVELIEASVEAGGTGAVGARLTDGDLWNYVREDEMSDGDRVVYVQEA